MPARFQQRFTHPRSLNSENGRLRSGSLSLESCRLNLRNILCFTLVTVTSLAGCQSRQLVDIDQKKSSRFVDQKRPIPFQPMLTKRPHQAAPKTPLKNLPVKPSSTQLAKFHTPDKDSKVSSIQLTAGWKPTRKRSKPEDAVNEKPPRILNLDNTVEQIDKPTPPPTPAPASTKRRPLILDIDTEHGNKDEDVISTQSEELPAPGVEEASLEEGTTTSTIPENSLTDEVLTLPPSPETVASLSGENGYPIDLPNVLRLAGAQNWSIQLAAERVREAHANLKTAKVLWIPSIHAAVGYNKHEGQIQGTLGNVVNVNRSSFFVGGGAGLGNFPTTGGAGGPARLFIDVSLADAIFEPLAAKQLVTAERASESATFNNTLMESSLAYYNLVNAQGQLSIAQNNLHDAEEVYKLTNSFVAAGKGSKADTARARVEVSIREQAVVQAKMISKVAASELTRLLQLEPDTNLYVWEDQPVTIELVEESIGLQALIDQAQCSRPEVVEQYAKTEASNQRAKAERWRPFLPNFHIGFSGGGFGGDRSNNATNNFDGRGDFDALAIWQVKNLGFGTQADQQRTKSQYQQNLYASYQVLDIVAAEVSKAFHRVHSQKERIGLTQANVEQAAQSYQKNIARIRGLEGLPLEALQSLQAVAQARELYLDSVVDYNQAQLQLLRAIGQPITQ